MGFRVSECVASAVAAGGHTGGDIYRQPGRHCLRPQYGHGLYLVDLLRGRGGSSRPDPSKRSTRAALRAYLQRLQREYLCCGREYRRADLASLGQRSSGFDPDRCAEPVRRYALRSDVIDGSRERGESAIRVLHVSWRRGRAGCKHREEALDVQYRRASAAHPEKRRGNSAVRAIRRAGLVSADYRCGPRPAVFRNR